MAIIKYSEGTIHKVTQPSKENEKELQEKLEKAAAEQEEINKKAEQEDEVPSWVKN